MRTEVMTCPQCGMHYNATDYTECPYCANGMTTKAAAKKKRRWWGREAAGSAPEAKQAPPAPQAPPKRPDPVREAPVQKAPEVPDLHHKVAYEAALTERPVPEMAPEQMGQQRYPAWDTPKSNGQPQEAEPQKPLSNRIDSVEKTTAKYISYSGGEVTYPVVGWLVSVKGVYYGKSFPLRSGINRIGRSAEYEVPLIKDKSVSREVVLKIVYDPKKNAFSALPGENAMCYINENYIYEKMDLQGLESIELGDTEENGFIFVPLCGSNFSWSAYGNSGGKSMENEGDRGQ